MPITIDGSGTITGASTLATTVASPTLTTPNINSAQFATVTGTAPIYPCRAWVNFNGTGTVAIRASGNVSSITDNGVGSYSVNFTTAMPDANYSATVTSALTSNYPILGTGTLVAGAFSIAIANQTASTQAAADSSSVFVAVFR